MTSSELVRIPPTERFGWTSGRYGIERMQGYRHAEDKIIYMVMFDDCFQSPAMSPGMEVNYYGGGCFALSSGEVCRGNVVLFRLTLTKHTWQPTPTTNRNLRLILQMSDDVNLKFEYELHPLCKAEVAQMLQERTKALEQGGFARRTWRSHIRRKSHSTYRTKRGNVQEHDYDNCIVTDSG